MPLLPQVKVDVEPVLLAIDENNKKRALPFAKCAGASVWRLAVCPVHIVLYSIVVRKTYSIVKGTWKFM